MAETGTVFVISHPDDLLNYPISEKREEEKKKDITPKLEVQITKKEQVERVVSLLPATLADKFESVVNECWKIIETEMIPLIKWIQHGHAYVEGNLFLAHMDVTRRMTEFVDKRQNLFVVTERLPEKARVLEIGFGAGFSALLMLMSHPTLHLTCVDILQHNYTKPCFDFLVQRFGANRLTLLEGDSKSIKYPQHKFNLCHIDGDHSTNGATRDIDNCMKMVISGCVLIVNDTNHPHILELWHQKVQEYNLEPAPIFTVPTGTHDIRQVPGIARTSYLVIIEECYKIIQQDMLPIVRKCLNDNGKSIEDFEGNLFFYHQSEQHAHQYADKRRNFVCLCQQLSPNSKGLEIGFNSGFSALLMLLTNPTFNLICIDIMDHPYTQACFDYLQTRFGADRIKLIPGSSFEQVPLLKNEKFDLIHIDGDHSLEGATKDIDNCLSLMNSKCVVIMDDTEHFHLRDVWYDRVKKYGLQPPPSNIIATKYHDIRTAP